MFLKCRIPYLYGVARSGKQASYPQAERPEQLGFWNFWSSWTCIFSPFSSMFARGVFQWWVDLDSPINEAKVRSYCPLLQSGAWLHSWGSGLNLSCDSISSTYLFYWCIVIEFSVTVLFDEFGMKARTNALSVSGNIT